MYKAEIWKTMDGLTTSLEQFSSDLNAQATDGLQSNIEASVLCAQIKSAAMNLRNVELDLDL
jgi:hypothetical protein